MTSSSLSAMYIGVTNDLGRRVTEHRLGKGSEFVKQYRVTKLVYAEEFEQIEEAIAREKQLKGWKRIRKNELVRVANPEWKDLMAYDGSGAMRSFASLRTTDGPTSRRSTQA